jgi:hypothetical protein
MNQMEPLECAPEIRDDVRHVCFVLGDVLLPAAHGMPAASDMDVGGRQLDAVLRARPDLLPLLERAAAGRAWEAPMAEFDDLAVTDPPASDALTLAIVAGYYTHPTVHSLIGYSGQVPKNAQQLSEHEIDDEGLIELLEASTRRGPVYRPTPPSDAEGRTQGGPSDGSGQSLKGGGP